MSPEPVSNDQPVGATSDLYSVGIMLYGIAGEPPFTAAHGMVALMHLTDPVPDLVFREELEPSSALVAIVLRALEKDRVPIPRCGDAAGDQNAVPSLVDDQNETLAGGVAETIALSVTSSGMWDR